MVAHKDFTIEKVAEKQAELRDTIIKSFMVIFTSEKSQHLLLNKDIIDIAFSCLENVFLVSMEAKYNLSRLISIIFKFPQVQERLMNEAVILGIVYLLQSFNTADKKILSFLITASSYISLNFNFANSRLSLRILQALAPIMSSYLSEPDPRNSVMTKTQPTSGYNGKDSQKARQSSNENAVKTTENFLDQRLQSQITTPIEKRCDRDNCISAISNLLKGHPQNARFFTTSTTSRMILIEILRI